MIAMADVAKEIYLRVDQEEDAGVPALTRAGSLEIVRGIFDIMTQALLAGESIMIPKFGKFYVVAKPARKGRNPKSGESMDIPAKTVMKFRPSSSMKLALMDVEVPEPANKEKKPVKGVKPDKKKKK